MSYLCLSGSPSSGGPPWRVVSDHTAPTSGRTRYNKGDAHQRSEAALPLIWSRRGGVCQRRFRNMKLHVNGGVTLLSEGANRSDVSGPVWRSRRIIMRSHGLAWSGLDLRQLWDRRWDAFTVQELINPGKASQGLHILSLQLDLLRNVWWNLHMNYSLLAFLVRRLEPFKVVTSRWKASEFAAVFPRELEEWLSSKET